MITTYKTTTMTEANQRKVTLLETAIQSMLAESLRRGFFGTMVIELSIQDGTIQHVRSTREQIER